jgi:aspartyl/glutamyl-tRNA(Asn/Gln) amidotransferase subunit B (EC 6.3.5.-)
MHDASGFIEEYGLTAYDAGVLTDDRTVSDYYEQAVAAARTAA